MLKRLLILVLMLTGYNLYSQFECQIIVRNLDDSTIFFNDTTLCYKTSLELVTQVSDTLDYSWEPGGELGPKTDKFELEDTTTFILHGYNADSSYHCTDSVTLSIFPKVLIEFEQLGFDCPLASDTITDTICINRVKLKANITGGFPPYKYKWSSDSLIFNTLDGTNYDSSYVIANLCLNQTYSLTISDSLCVYTESYDIQPFDMPEIEVTVAPDSLFDTNPQAVLSYENKSADSIPLTSWTWIFPDGTSTNQLSPSYVFTLQDSLVKFTYTTIDNCNDTIIVPISVREFELTIPNVFTPNGDGSNDRYEVPYLDRYITSQLMVFNRWGEMVFKDDNYSGNWDGGRLSDGVYFYVLKCKGYWKEDIFKGSVSIYGSRY
jgi:gliding motility-associated-like protein